MKAPPLLIGAALVFWGWQSDLLLAGVLMAVILESARFLKARWELSDEDFSRIWTFCSLLFLASGIYGFTSNDGPSRVSELFSGGGFAATNNVGNASAKTAVLLIRWLPMSFFLFLAAQYYSDRVGIPLEAISLILRRQRQQAKQLRQPMPASRAVNISYPYFIACLFAASSHSARDNTGFFWGLCVLLAWALWPQRSRRFAPAIWAGSIALAFALGFGGQRGMVLVRQALERYTPGWLSGAARLGFDPLESRTAIGQIGRIKTSGRIVIRLETPDDGAPPTYLREASYRFYKGAVWYAGSSRGDFDLINERPPDSHIWPLLSTETNSNLRSVKIACYLSGGRALLPLPATSRRLEQLPAFILQKNTLGAVRAEGPGLVIFNALYGLNSVIDSEPNLKDDLAVPPDEKPVMDQIVTNLNLAGQDYEHALQTVANFFATQYAYSLWQELPRHPPTNSTPLSRFLLQTRKGHCEYFATATVLLLRDAGIPARYTVGYYAHEGSHGKYVVRQSDAHAWCRVWDAPRKHWEDFDTTPATWVDLEAQHRSVFQSISDAWSRVTFEISKFRWGQSNLRKYFLWALVPVLAVLLYQIIFRSGKRRKPAGALAGSKNTVRPGLDSEYYQLEVALARRGLIRPASEPLASWFRRLERDPQFPQLKEPLLETMRLHYRYRFDPQGLSETERSDLRREAARCVTLLP
jgi:transglutaminase-like putative cysteine protease